jgi:hypothetical protein
MNTLGEILERLHDPSEVRQLMLEAGDVAMIAGLDKASLDRDTDPAVLALEAVQAFTLRADDEAWVRLMGQIQDAQAPAAACLGEMLRWALAH